VTVTILDYGAGNLKSITNMLDSLCCSYLVSDEKKDIKDAEKLIFPGVGNFDQVMEALNIKDLTETVTGVIKSGIPFLGICLGFQVLFEESEEAPDVKGLGIFPGKVIKFTEGKVPQIGWNKLETTRNNSILTDDYVYFVNSYHVVPDDSSIISAYSDYHIKYTASIEANNIIGVQFHPERSGEVGRNILKNWLNLYN
jgi:imidazole glycerol phosphate synthase glutamine amidotransferase subunit